MFNRKNGLKQIDLCRKSQSRTARGIALIASFAVVLILVPRHIQAQSSDPRSALPNFKALGFEEPILLENGLARSLIYDLRQIEPAPPGVEFKASQLEK